MFCTMKGGVCECWVRAPPLSYTPGPRDDLDCATCQHYLSFPQQEERDHSLISILCSKWLSSPRPLEQVVSMSNLARF